MTLSPEYRNNFVQLYCWLPNRNSAVVGNNSRIPVQRIFIEIIEQLYSDPNFPPQFPATPISATPISDPNFSISFSHKKRQSQLALPFSVFLERLWRYRFRRPTAARPSSPVPKSSIVVGSGTGAEPTSPTWLNLPTE